MPGCSCLSCWCDAGQYTLSPDVASSLHVIEAFVLIAPSLFAVLLSSRPYLSTCWPVVSILLSKDGKMHLPSRDVDLFWPSSGSWPLFSLFLFCLFYSSSPSSLLFVFLTLSSFFSSLPFSSTIKDDSHQHHYSTSFLGLSSSTSS